MTETAGQRIEKRRKELGFKQGELAKMAGISQSTLSELESGESKMPSAKALVGLSKALGVTKAWIITGEDGEIESLPQEEAEHIKAIRKLTVEQRRAVYNLVRSFDEGDDKT